MTNENWVSYFCQIKVSDFVWNWTCISTNLEQVFCVIYNFIRKLQKVTNNGNGIEFPVTYFRFNLKLLSFHYRFRFQQMKNVYLFFSGSKHISFLKIHIGKFHHMNFEFNIQWTYSAGLMSFATRGSRPGHLTYLKITTVTLVNCLSRFYSNPMFPGICQ